MLCIAVRLVLTLVSSARSALGAVTWRGKSLTLATAVELGAHLLGCAVAPLRAIVRSYVTCRDVEYAAVLYDKATNERTPRGHGSEAWQKRYWAEQSRLRDVHRDAIRELLERELRGGQSGTVGKVSRMLRDRFQLQLRDREIRDFMRSRCQCVYGKPPSARVDLSSPQFNPMLRRFLALLAVALADERAGRAVIVCFDETFSHVGEYDEHSWYPLDEDGIPVVIPVRGIGAGAGDLYIMLHAISRFGPLRVLGADGRPIAHLPEHSALDSDNAFCAFRPTDDAVRIECVCDALHHSAVL
jgi:hypothetical protein